MRNPTHELFAHIVVLERASLPLRFSVKLKLEGNIVKCSYEISANYKVTRYVNTSKQVLTHSAPLLVDLYCRGFRPNETKWNKEKENIRDSEQFLQLWEALNTAYSKAADRISNRFLAKNHTARARFYTFLHAFVKWKYNRIKENVKLKCWC